ncbi:N-acetylmuramoyl-L-alanine amidase family protein [Desulfotomaculum sp. 1211_IL3151]|uniref:N-acetylmuramoyl-L-alanine amidase family protein n=1 Tax=Desulfotomaculum sp. 1211_IL3151 TaxID=3084055 RepID=UPI002FD8F7CA
MPRKILVLDPGHGGQDPGAVGNGLLEKEITLELGKKVAQRLANYDVTVRLTRENDTYISLTQRTAFANNLKADYFLSIHVNAGGGTGFESFIYNGGVSSATINIRSEIHDTLVSFLQNHNVVDRGKKKANFAVIRETIMPAALIENLFIDSIKDTALLKNIDFMNDLSDAITLGLVKGLNLVQVTPTKPPQPPTIWDPQGEVQQLIDAGILANHHPADKPVTWGEFAAVINRIIKMK